MRRVFGGGKGGSTFKHDMALSAAAGLVFTCIGDHVSHDHY